MREYRDELLGSVASDIPLHGNKGAFFDLFFANGDTMLEPLWEADWLVAINESSLGHQQELRQMLNDKLTELQAQGKLLWLKRD